MKRHNNLFDKIVDKDNLLLAYKKAKKHKSWQQKVIRVEKDLDNLIEELRLSLIKRKFMNQKKEQFMCFHFIQIALFIML